jgi:predicted flap endonuclease-1-like 5' DNA nuclease
MEELVAVILGTGAVVFSPFLIPGLRPVAKSAIKGGMAVADAAKGFAVATGEGYRDAVNKASAALKPAAKPEMPEAAADEESGATAEAAQAVTEPEGQAYAKAASPVAEKVTPIVNAIVSYGHSVANVASEKLAQVGAQWNQIVSDAQAERKAAELSREVAVPAIAPVTTQAPATAAVDAAQPPAAVSSAPAEAVESGDDLEQIAGIGPKVAEVLREYGITTFDQLAASDSGELKALLVHANPRYRMFDTTSWPSEARRLSEARNS